MTTGHSRWVGGVAESPTSRSLWHHPHVFTNLQILVDHTPLFYFYYIFFYVLLFISLFKIILSSYYYLLNLSIMEGVWYRVHKKQNNVTNTFNKSYNQNNVTNTKVLSNTSHKHDLWMICAPSSSRPNIHISIWGDTLSDPAAIFHDLM